jgi:type VI secretion system protein VasG
MTHPYSVVLLDEVEKAHPIVMNIFLKILDEGSFTSSDGTIVDCQNVMFILTSNIAAKKVPPYKKKAIQLLKS